MVSYINDFLKRDYEDEIFAKNFPKPNCKNYSFKGFMKG